MKKGLVSPPQEGKSATSQASPFSRKYNKTKKVSLAELSRKIDILIGALIAPEAQAAALQGQSVDDALRAEAARLSVKTGDYSYIKDYQAVKNQRLKEVQHGHEA